MTQVGRILIVGGGIAGLAAAAALRRVGFHAEVFEQASGLREVGAGVGLWSNAMASLDQIGAGAAVRTSSSPIRVVAGAGAAGNTTGTSLDLDELGAEFANAACFVVKRPALRCSGSQYFDCLPKDIIHTNSRVIRVEPRADGVSLHLAGERVEEGALLIGADGLHSVVRPLVVGDDALRYSGQTCFRGLARVAAPRPYVLREVQGRGQRGSVCPIDDETVYWWVAHNSPPNALVAPEARKPQLLERYGSWPFGIGEAIDATPSDAILQNDLVDRKPVESYVSGRLVLVGDAAHPTTPNLGQGANMAIDDSIVLARSLRDESSAAEGAPALRTRAPAAHSPDRRAQLELWPDVPLGLGAGGRFARETRACHSESRTSRHVALAGAGDRGSALG